MNTDLDANTKEWWDFKGQNYGKRGDNRDRPEESKAAARFVIGSCLEIGPCFGHFTKYLNPHCQYLGLEKSPYLHSESVRTYPNRVFMQGDIVNVWQQFAKSFDTVCGFQLIEHFDNPAELLNQMATIARKRIVFSVPRGKASASSLKNDGHVSWWTDEKHFAQAYKAIGDINFWAGADNHICGYIDIKEK